MADTIDWNVFIRLAVQGAKGSKTELEGVQRAAEGLSREGKNVEKGLEQATRAMNRTQAAAKSATVDYNKFAEGSISLRYANYDVARTMLSVSAGFAAVGTGAVVAAAQYESAFTAVERTTGLAGDSASQLREELMQLTREIPQSFADISSLAARGAQLGIDASEIKDFTEVVAQFVATSDTVTLDQAVEAFGRISNLLGDSNFNALGSAITLVGVNAAATEGQIVKTTQELAPFGAAVGLASDEVIALAAAVASLGQPPERARSAFLTLQKVVDGAVSGMNDKLGAFSTLLGMTEQETANLWKQDPGQFIQSFVTALGGVENLTGAFAALGINERRAVQVFQALAADSKNAAGGMSVLSQAFADANKGYTEQSELQRQYALIVDDLASKWQILMNAVMEFAAAAGGSAMPTIKDLVDGLAALIQQAAQFVQTDLGQRILQWASAAVVLVSAYAALRGVIALSTASIVGLNFAARALGGAGVISSIKGLLGAIGLIKTSADGATKSAFTLRGALLGVGRATLIVGLFQLAAEVLFNTGEAAEFVGDRIINLIDILASVSQAVGPLLAVIGGPIVTPLLTFGDEIKGFGKSLSDWGKANKNVDTSAEDLTKTLTGLTPEVEDTDAAMEDYGNTLDTTAEKVRTLADYASDLSSVFSRAFEIRYNSQSTLDTIATSFQSIRNSSEEAQRSIRGLKAEIEGLTSDLNIQQRFLAIALEYQDYDRAQAIQANIAKLQSDLADKSAQLTKEQDKNSKTLEGNSSAAIGNRNTIRDLVSQYQAHISALASSGLTQEELARQTEILRQDFIEQATQLGFNRGELALYEQSFYDVATAINGVPRDITVGFNADPALQALNEFAARAKEQMGSLGPDLGNVLGQGIGSGISSGVNTALADALAQTALTLTKIGQSGLFLMRPRSSGGGSGGGGGGGWAEGGYTGAGGKYEPAGIVHRGEYVIPKHQVNQRTGLPYADAMGRLQRGISGRSGYSGGGFVSGGSMGSNTIDRYGPMALQQMMAAFQTYLNLDGRTVAQSVNQQNARATNTGAY